MCPVPPPSGQLDVGRSPPLTSPPGRLRHGLLTSRAQFRVMIFETGLNTVAARQNTRTVLFDVSLTIPTDGTELYDRKLAGQRELSEIGRDAGLKGFAFGSVAPSPYVRGTRFKNGMLCQLRGMLCQRGGRYRDMKRGDRDEREQKSDSCIHIQLAPETTPSNNLAEQQLRRQDVESLLLT
jgi:hypothetical protein